MYKLLVSIAIFVLVFVNIPHSSATGNLAPMQVEMDVENEVYLWDCWPFQDGEDYTVIVYAVYPGGVAGYGCTGIGVLEEVPIVPLIEEELAWGY